MSEEKNLPALSKDAEKILDLVSKLSVLDLANLVKHLEDVFGVSAAAPAAAAAAPAAGGDDAAEQSEFDVIITAAGPNKINAIKVIKEITGLGLKEAKGLVDGAPKTVKEKLNKADADAMKAKIEESGASAELK
ncbi:50S ribosomal protein L7/L12 [Candidatus Peregrinibacteria bacterium]|nr:MAG: 50S ribosomal protein L7/L12 [Candidatus Peregrinibacteria bacterium]